jgi:hypothetical protein
MPGQIHSVAMVGYGTYQISATLASQTLQAALGITGAWPVGVKHADIQVYSGELFYSEDGATATANSMSLAAGERMLIRNCEYLLQTMTVFSSAAVVVKVSLKK